ncbi:alpha-amylase family glycosyl hydrolase [Nonomuraea sp. NPDC026600]|uniref:alpha-amylase family glycosyl hydrolase n=1 Tax=Nonomuraea sp. NPDC026600 TaxID=3155363 RepID=UPI0033F5439B
MANIDEIIGQAPPRSIWEAVWPQRESFHPSPSDWRDEVIYFLLPDRFSDGREVERDPVDRARPANSRPAGWMWNRWAASGRDRFQGGTLRGVISKLDYLRDLGVSALWIAPVWKQRPVTSVDGVPAPDDPHGYSIQHFLDIDRRFGTREDLVELVREAHERGIRIILDILINHTGENWDYDLGTPGHPQYVVRPPYAGRDGRLPFGAWRDGTGQRLPLGTAPTEPDHGVWPSELHDPDAYTRAGGDGGGWGAGGDEEPDAPYRRADWFSRDLDQSRELQTIIRIWSYWVALTDIDGVRIDTLKHVPPRDATLFCGALKEFADGLGKANFLIVGEVGGGDTIEERYLSLIGRNLSAVLETGETRRLMREVALGREGFPFPDAVEEFFSRFATQGVTHRSLGSAYVSSLDDHDDLWIDPQLRFGALTPPGRSEPDPRQVTVGVALLLYSLGIPCLYYGTEQGLTGPEEGERGWLRGKDEGWGVRDLSGDRYLREAMFGPEHPRKAGAAGRPADDESPTAAHLFDTELPGFGPFGTANHHVFDQDNEIYQRVRMLLATRAAHRALRVGRQYLRRLGRADGGYALPRPGEVLCWSRVLAGTEVVCVVNPSLTETRGALVEIDGALNARTQALTVVANTAEVGGVTKHPLKSAATVLPGPGASRHIELQDLPPASVLVLTNQSVG